MSDPGDALRSSHARLPAALCSQSTILIALDPSGGVLLWNSGAERSFGLTEEQTRGVPFVRCPIAWDWSRVEALAPGGVARQEARIVMPFRRPDGRDGVVAFQVKPQWHAGHDLSGCLWLGSDTGQPAIRLAPDPQRLRTPLPLPKAPDPQRLRTPLPAAPGSPAGPRSDPAHQFPMHSAFLDSHLVAAGEDPARWRIVQAEETRLDDRGMEVLFTLSRRFPAQGQMRRRILVSSGELAWIRDQ